MSQQSVTKPRKRILYFLGIGNVSVSVSVTNANGFNMVTL